MRSVPLGELAEIVSGATPKTSDARFWNGDVLWATPADLSVLNGPYIGDTSRTLTSDGLNSCATRVLPPESVLLSSRAPIGYVAINTRPMATNQGFKSLIPKPGLDAKFLYHWLKANTSYVQSLGNGATFKELSKSSVEKISIPVPDLPEQRRIAAILDQADAIRTKRRQVLTHLDSLTQSIFHDMFDGYPTRKLSEVVKFYSGGTPSKKREDYWQGSNPWFSAKDLKRPDLFDSQDHIGDHVFTETSLRKLPKDTVVVVIRGMILAHTLPASILRVSAAINQDLKALLPNGDLSIDFLAAAVRARSNWILQRVSTAAHGTKKLETRVLETVPIPSASPDMQREFEQRVSASRLSAQSARAQLQQADELFASLQYRAFRGEL